jgi:hypothetical protein
MRPPAFAESSPTLNAALSRVREPDDDQPVGIWQWKRAQKHGVYDAEDQRVGTDAESQRADDRRANTRPPQKRARVIFEVGPDLRDGKQRVGFARPFLDACPIAELP